MNWKRNLQVGDLEAGQRLEMTCVSCGHVHYLTPATVKASPEREYLYLDELEDETVCRARGCRGRVRLALLRKGDASGFVGGLA